MAALDASYKPTREARKAAYDAVENYALFKTFGMPKAGGYDDQDAEWVDGINACTYSMQKVEAELERKAQREAEEASKKSRRKR